MDRYSHLYGNLAYGKRTVKKGGIIKWDGRTFQSDALINCVGERVDVYFAGLNTFADGPIQIIPTYGGSIYIERSTEAKALKP